MKSKKNKDKETISKNIKNSLKKLKFLKPVFWFFVGVLFASFCVLTFLLIYFKITYKDKVIPGVFVGDTYVGDKTPLEVQKIFEEKNNKIWTNTLTFKVDEKIATASAKDLKIGYDEKLISTQTENLGKSKDLLSNAYYIINAYINGVYLSPATVNTEENVKKVIEPLQKEVYKQPADAIFKVEGNRVIAFVKSENGKTINFKKLMENVSEKIPHVLSSENKNFIINIPIKTLEPKIKTEEANDLGIVEEIGSGTSYFSHSIPNRIHNVALAASRINGVIVPPNEIFSFVKNLGDVSKYTGYKEAYVIENGKTVLGDGGGVCQVSTTLFRAVLNAGLPILERTAHAYRVGYYEENSPPGIDATVFYPSVDFKFKNDTGKHIFIEETIDLNNLMLTFTIYGKKDGRITTITTPVVTNQSVPPEPLYQDDPTLPNGTVKQVDFAAPGATVSFSRTVSKNGKTIISDTYKSVYRPWRAVFLKGTKTG